MTNRYDACIVGAGISGLNALFVASRHLSREQRVNLVDRRFRAGGMWLDTYDYVRLHQPHPFFTAGDIAWALGKEPEYPATKEEVQDHLHHCLEMIKQRIRVTELFGCEFENCEEVDRTVRITCRSDEGQAIEIKADRLIKAYGQEIETNAPLELSSAHARSVSPDQFNSTAGTRSRSACDHRPDSCLPTRASVSTTGGRLTRLPSVSMSAVSRCALFTGQANLRSPLMDDLHAQ